MPVMNSADQPSSTAINFIDLAAQIKLWGKEIGFAEIRITDPDIAAAEPGLAAWLNQGMHGSMDYMAKHGTALRTQPARLVPGTLRIISARMDYLPQASTAEKNISDADTSNTAMTWQDRELAKLQQPHQAVISIYARGRDYHKVLRSRLQKLAQKIRTHVGQLGYRVFTDSAPVLEVELARKAGLGWRGKHTLLLSRSGGSMFFLGEIFVDIPLPCDSVTTDHCGTCQRCIDVCPTQAIIAPYQLDARRCISYLTIEHAGSIPEDLRPLLGNRIYGCDDCQLVCPWNKYAQPTALTDFSVRHQLDQQQLLALFTWSEEDFHHQFSGSAIHRIGYIRWLRNLAVALGNALRAEKETKQKQAIETALQTHAAHTSIIVREHVLWALSQKDG